MLLMQANSFCNIDENHQFIEKKDVLIRSRFIIFRLPLYASIILSYFLGTVSEKKNIHTDSFLFSVQRMFLAVVTAICDGCVFDKSVWHGQEKGKLVLKANVSGFLRNETTFTNIDKGNQ